MSQVLCGAPIVTDGYLPYASLQSVVQTAVHQLFTMSVSCVIYEQTIVPASGCLALGSRQSGLQRSNSWASHNTHACRRWPASAYLLLPDGSYMSGTLFAATISQNAGM